MNGVELFLLGRKLMKIGEEAIPRNGFRELPTSVRSILLDVFEHPDTSVGEIATRTGFPQSHISASVAKLRDEGVFVTTIDPSDRRRTLVRRSPEVTRRVATKEMVPIRDALSAALGSDDESFIAQISDALDLLAEHLNPDAIAKLRTESGAPAC
jgi:DNA-binding MarR family transcriptional regulator